MSKRGLLIVISGPSGSGKGTVVRRLLDRYTDTVLSVSATTRQPRPGEEEGVHYFFKTRQAFEEMIARDAFFEYAEYNGNYYGTPQEPVDTWLAAGRHVILEIDVQGAQKVMAQRPDVVSLFIVPPSIPELERRLRERGTETEECIRERLHAARWELSRLSSYTYAVVNDEVEQALRRVRTIIEAEQMRVGRIEQELQEVLSYAETDRH